MLILNELEVSWLSRHSLVSSAGCGNGPRSTPLLLLWLQRGARASGLSSPRNCDQGPVTSLCSCDTVGSHSACSTCRTFDVGSSASQRLTWLAACRSIHGKDAIVDKMHVVIFDAHPLFRQGVRQTLTGVPDIEERHLVAALWADARLHP
jgi:hypothetical protein